MNDEGNFTAAEEAMAMDLMMAYIDADFDRYDQQLEHLVDEYEGCAGVLMAMVNMFGVLLAEIDRRLPDWGLIEQTKEVYAEMIAEHARAEAPPWLGREP